MGNPTFANAEILDRADLAMALWESLSDAEREGEFVLTEANNGGTRDDGRTTSPIRFRRLLV